MSRTGLVDQGAVRVSYDLNTKMGTSVIIKLFSLCGISQIMRLMNCTKECTTCRCT